MEFGKGERRHEDRQSYFIFYLVDNAIFVTEMDTMPEIAGIVVRIHATVRDGLWKMEEDGVVVVKDITIVGQADTLVQVLQAEEATEDEEVIAGIMTEGRTIGGKKIRTIIPETIDSHESAKIIFILQYKYGR